uniref:Secreted protein n=1 Tax=Angiostrongylus cantonensis TaxID=6313 RepID=A0A0K0D657_ANGCA
MKLALVLVAFACMVFARPQFDMNSGTHGRRGGSHSGEGTQPEVDEDNHTTTEDYDDSTDEEGTSGDDWNKGRTLMLDLKDDSSEKLTTPEPDGGPQKPLFEESRILC